MARFRLPLGTLLVAICLGGHQDGAHAGIVATGAVGPGDPATWTSDTTYAYVGGVSGTVGSLTVNAGDDIFSRTATIGARSGSTGEVAIEGTGSTWTNTSFMYVGEEGSGRLEITGGGTVTNGYYGYIGYDEGSTGVVTVDGTGSRFSITDASLYVGDLGNGTLNIRGGGAVDVLYDTYVGYDSSAINFGPGGGTLTTGSLWASAGQLSGTGTIITQGLVSDFDLVFDSPESLTKTLAFGGLPSRDITVHLDLTDPINNGAIGAGFLGSGSLTIRNETKLDSFEGSIGDGPGSTGVANVEGSGSEWNPWALLSVGGYGHGTLNINGGADVNSGSGWVGSGSEATGVVNVDGNGSTWLIDGRLHAGDLGTGTVNVTHGGTIRSSDYLDLGNEGHGALNINSGGTVHIQGQAYLGMHSSATGAITVDGIGSSLTIDDWLEIGTGRLNITNGGAVSTGSGGVSLAWWAGSEATVTVDGSGSTWTNTDPVEFGDGVGRLQITGGGLVTAESLSLSAQSLLAMDIGKGSHLDLGSGEMANGGVVRMAAAADAAAGPYRPITAGVWSGGGVYEALGGTWESDSHLFTVSESTQGTAGADVTIDLANVQRVLISDTVTGRSVGTSFAPAGSSTLLTLQASPISGVVKTSLENLLDPSQSLLAGWEFAASEGYTSGDPVYLSFEVGEGLLQDGLMAWHYDGAAWTPFAAADLAYHGRYANFTVTGFSGYAIAASVPEPTTLALLASGLLTAVFYAWRRLPVAQ